MGQLTPETLDAVRAIAEPPDVIRDYEDIKLANVGRFRARAAELTPVSDRFGQRFGRTQE